MIMLSKLVKGNALIIIISVVVLIIFYVNNQSQIESSQSVQIQNQNLSKENEVKKEKYNSAIELDNPTGFINTDPITLSEFVGKKIVLLHFWSSSCLNCKRIIPYLNKWQQKYNKLGLEIISIHTPEFEFEKDQSLLSEFIKKSKIKYPIVVDNEYNTFFAYQNQYWPRTYLMDIDGFLVFDQVGEKNLGEIEVKIQELLQERVEDLALEDLITVPKDKIKVDKYKDTDLSKILSPSFYFGAKQNDLLNNGARNIVGEQSFESGQEFELNRFYLSGNWKIEAEYSESLENNSEVIISYNAKDVYIVVSSEQKSEIRVFLNDKEKESIMISKPGLYQVIQEDTYEESLLKLKIKDKGVRIYVVRVS